MDRASEPRWNPIVLLPSLLLLSAALLLPEPLAAQGGFNTTLRSNPQVGSLAGCWGDGNFAYASTFDGIVIVDATDPDNPVVAARYETGATSGTWEVKVAKGYAYLPPQDSGVGIVILDVHDPYDPVLVSQFSHPAVTSVHTIWVDSTTDVAYCASNTTGRVEMVDVSDPANPTYIGFYAAGAGFIHDMVVLDGVMYASFLSGGFHIVDVSDPANPIRLGSKQYPGNFTHNAWPTEDRRYLCTTDEVENGHLRIWDISDPADIRQVGEYQSGQGTIIHNVHVRGDFAHISYYAQGYRVVDISDPTDPVEVGFYDTFPGSGGGFNGAWEVYPYSDHLYVSDISGSLFIVDFNGARKALVQGSVRNALDLSLLSGALVRFIEMGLSATTDSLGAYSLLTASGTHTVAASRFGFFPDTSSATLSPDSTTVHDIALQPIATGGIAGRVTQEGTGEGIGALVILSANGAPYATDSAAADGSYAFEGVPATTPGLVAYDGISVDPALPFVPAVTEGEVVVDAGSTTVVDFALHPARILVVDDDEGATYEEKYRVALEALALDDSTVLHDVARRGSAATAFQAFPPSAIVVWFTGNAASNTITPEEADSLLAFLDRGGKVLLTGQNITQDLCATDPDFLSALGVCYGGSSTEAFVEGIPGDPVGDGLNLATVGGDGANNQTSRDILAILGGQLPPPVVRPSFEYAPGIVAAVRVDWFSGARALLYGFGLEAVNGTNPSFASRAEVLHRSFAWLRGVPVGVEPGPGNQALPRAFSLGANYPNPFNPSTTIPFTLPGLPGERADIRLRIYDLRGRVVRTLLEGRLLAGDHVAHWDGRDAQGRPVASGAYLGRLECGGHRSVRRMLLVR